MSVSKVLLTRPYGFMSDKNKCSVQRLIRILRFSYFWHHAVNPIERNRCSLPQPLYPSIVGSCFFNPALSIIVNHYLFQTTGFRTSSNSRLLLINHHMSAQPQSATVISPCKYTAYNWFLLLSYSIVKHLFPSSSFWTTKGNATTFFK
mgnify:CR=1 FL=1